MARRLQFVPITAMITHKIGEDLIASPVFLCTQSPTVNLLY